MKVRFGTALAIGLLATVFAAVAYSQPVTSFPYLQDFDSWGVDTFQPVPLSDGWTNDGTDGTQDWRIGSGSTPSVNGPSSGHGGTGNYLYYEDSNGHNTSGEVRMTTPEFDLSAVNLPEFSFWVHSFFNTTYGAHPLHIDLINVTTSTTTTDVIPPIVGTTNAWTNFTFDLAPYSGNVIQIQFRLEEVAASFYNDVSIDTVEVLGVPDGAAVIPSNYSGQARVGGTDVPAASFDLAAFGPAAQDFTSVTLSYTGSLNTADISNIKLWDDANDNGFLDTGESQIGSTVSSFTSGTAGFIGSPLISIPANTTVNVLVTCDIDPGAAGKETISFEITDSTDVNVSPGPDQGQYPVNCGGVETIEYFSNLPFFTDFAGGTEAGNQSLEFEAGTYPTGAAVPGSATSGEDGSMSFTGSPPGVDPVSGTALECEFDSPSAVTALDSRFDLSAYDEAVHDVYLTFGWYEEDWPEPTGDDFNYVFLSDDAGQTWFASPFNFDETVNSPNWTNSRVNLSEAFVSAGRSFTQDIIVRIQVGGTSTTPVVVFDYVEVREIYAGAYASAEAPSNTDVPSGSSASPAYGRYGIALEDDLVVQVFTLQPEFDDQSVSEITVTNAGTMADSDITSVKLWLDVNYNGRLDSNDVLLGNETYSSGEATFSFTPIPINLGTTRDFLVTYSFTATASGDLGCQIGDASDLVISPDQAYAYGTFPIGEDMGTAATPTATLPYLEDFENPPSGNIAAHRDAGVYPTAAEAGGNVGDTNTSNAAELGWWAQFNGINPNDGSAGMGTYEFVYGDAAAALDFTFDLSAYSAASDDLLFRLAWLNDGLDEGMASQDHVFLSNDGGETWITSLIELDPEGQEGQWTSSFASVSEALLDAGQDYTSEMVIRVQFASDNDNAMIDDVELFVLSPTPPTIGDPQATGGGVAAVGFPEWLYYKFDEGTGSTALNEAVPGVGSQNATIQGTPAWNDTTNPVGNSAASFGNESTNQDTAKLYSGWQPVIPASQSFTVEFWMNRSNSTASYVAGDSSATSWRFYFLGYLSMRGGGFGLLNTSFRWDNNPGWHHVAWVYDASVNEVHAYIDGAHDNTWTGQSPSINGTEFQVGGYAGTTNAWPGDVDEFRFWNHARSGQDIQTAYQSELQNYPSLDFQGNNPNYTATIEQGGDLNFNISANDINTGDSLTFTVTEIGGSLTAEEAGFDQEFVGGVYNDPNPNQPAPHSIALTGVADMLGDIELEVSVEDSTGLSESVTIHITIIPAAQPLVRAVPQELHPMNAYGFGIPSVPEKTTIQGYGLTGDLTITAPPQFEVSQTASVGYSNSLSLTPVSGNIQRTDIYVRYNPSVSGPHDGEVVASGPGVQIDAKIKVEGFILPQIPAAIDRPTSAGAGTELLALAQEEPKADESGYPVNTWWHDLRMESIYLASELEDAGIDGGAPITQIEFRVSEQPGMDLENVRIRMGHTSSNTITDFSTAGLERVYGPASLSMGEFTVDEWYAFKFDTPFIWNGVDNVIVDFSMDGTEFEGPGGIYMRQVGPDRSRTGYDDSGSSYPFNGIANQTGLNEVPSIRMSQGLSISGSQPDYTAVGVVGDPLNLEFLVTNANAQQTVNVQITEVGGTLNASQIGFNQQFSGGVYSYPNPGRAPLLVALDGTAATTGTLDLLVSANDGTFDTTINVSIEIVDQPGLSVEGVPFPTFVAPTSGGPSNEQSITVSGGNLLSDVTVTVPDEFGISTTSGSGYGSSVALSPSGGVLNATTLYVIYDPSSGSNASAGDMVIATDRVTSMKELMFGVVGDDPVMTTLDTPIPTLFAPAIGTPGDPYDFTVLVANPIGPVTVMAPSEFEISLSEDSGFGDSVSVAPPQGGTSQLTMVVFVRYNPPGPTDSAAGDITVAASSAAPLALAVQGQVGDGPSGPAGDGSGDDGGGCSTGTTEYSTWMLLISALAALMLATRLRQARE